MQAGLNLNKINTIVDLYSDKYSTLKYIKTDLSEEIIKALQSQINRIQYEEIQKSQVKILLEEDINRQSILERLGWRFIRIRGSEFFSDESGSMKRIIQKLNEFKIYPEQNNTNSNEDTNLQLVQKLRQKCRSF